VNGPIYRSSPPYAPDLNPVELLWSYLKYGRLANFAPDTVADIQSNVCLERRRLARHPELLGEFLSSLGPTFSCLRYDIT